jgi:hypothetical protein
MKKENILSKFLGVEKNQIKKIGRNTFESCEGEYIILTDRQANKETREYILNYLWTFNADFILKHSKHLDVLNQKDLKNSIYKLQIDLCESANPVMRALIKNINKFIEDAINSDGRGHFLSSYDGNEIEYDGFYIYRIN